MLFTVGMTIWILALVLLAASIALGHKLGAINASFTFFGILFGAVLAAPLGKLFKPLLSLVGIHDQTAVWVVSPIVAFVVVMVLFRIAGHFVHRKVEVYYKYKAGDLRLALWERLNTRLGACIGTLNGTAYLVLISFLIFNFSYWTAQVAASGSESRAAKLVNHLGNDLQSTGMAKPARSLVTMDAPGSNTVNFYKLADLAGLICQNPQLSDRLANYPAFISLTERDDLQQLTRNADFTNAWNSRAPMGELLNQPAFKAILQNKDLIDAVWKTVQANLDDLVVYLKTGKSPKYDGQKILGHWDFNMSTTIAMLRQARPDISATEMRSIRALWTQGYENTTFVAGGDGQAFLKNLPDFKSNPPKPETWKGSWTANGTNYDLSLSGSGADKSMTAQTDGERLTIKDNNGTLFFDRED
jgi:phosphate/sulfate permease